MVVKESFGRRELIGIFFFEFFFILWVVLKCEVFLVIVDLIIILEIFCGKFKYMIIWF